jgi:hypothetical protein
MRTRALTADARVVTAVTNVSPHPVVIRRKISKVNNLRNLYPDATNFGFRPHFSRAEL